MNKILKKLIALGLSFALISSNGIYLQAEENINEQTNDSNAEYNNISILAFKLDFL